MPPAAGPLRLYGIGYSGRTVDELIERLRAAGVDLVIDVRLHPVSRRTGFSKRGLAEALARADIRYRHEPTLGNPKENRAGFRREDTSAARSAMRARLEEPDADALSRVVGEARTGTVALLCLERDVARCHRAVVLDAAHTLDPSLGWADLD